LIKICDSRSAECRAREQPRYQVLQVLFARETLLRASASRSRFRQRVHARQL